MQCTPLCDECVARNRRIVCKATGIAVQIDVHSAAAHLILRPTERFGLQRKPQSVGRAGGKETADAYELRSALRCAAQRRTGCTSCSARGSGGVGGGVCSRRV